MTEQDDHPGNGSADAKAGSRLRVVAGGAATAAEPPPPVRLRREFKGLTVADLHRAEIARHLPGQVRTALQHLEAGDYEMAERALPGRFGTVLEGPGRRRRSARWGWLLFAGALALLVGWLVAGWLTS